MKTTLKLTPLIAVMLLTSCNEKVSPELQDSNSSSTVGSVVPPSEYYFKVTETSSSLNYKLHKTGDGNATATCQVSKGVALSNLLYAGGDTGSDISCFMEAEELALFFSGMNLKIEASANTCEYVAYSPYSFYYRQPGDSSADLTQITCTSTGIPHIAAAVAAYNGSSSLPAVSIASSTGPATCGQYVDDNLSDITRVPFTNASDASLCRYNYTNGAREQCDIGTITVREIVAEDDSGSLKVPVTVNFRTIDCAGSLPNCVKGPIKILDTANVYTRMTEIYETTINQTFSNTFTFPGLIVSGTTNSTYEYANFRRDLAGFEIDFDETNAITYNSAFAGVKDYTTQILDRYSNNMDMNGNNLIDDTTHDDWSIIRVAPGDPASDAPIRTSRPLAAEPFLGLDGNRIQPFYTFYCLDSALDTKARIRLIVREWDRTLPAATALEVISDINMLGAARQDIPNMEELPGDNETWNVFDDRQDWDSLVSNSLLPIVPMERTPGPYDPTSTIWRPIPATAVRGGLSTTYLEGFFNPNYFPGR